MAANLVACRGIPDPIGNLRSVPTWIAHMIRAGIIRVPVSVPLVSWMDHLGMFGCAWGALLEVQVPYYGERCGNIELIKNRDDVTNGFSETQPHFS